MQKQRALVENEQLRMELEATRQCIAEHETMQATFVEADSEFTHACTMSYKIQLSLDYKGFQ